MCDTCLQLQGPRFNFLNGTFDPFNTLSLETVLSVFSLYYIEAKPPQLAVCAQAL